MDFQQAWLTCGDRSDVCSPMPSLLSTPADVIAAVGNCRHGGAVTSVSERQLACTHHTCISIMPDALALLKCDVGDQLCARWQTTCA